MSENNEKQQRDDYRFAFKDDVDPGNGYSVYGTLLIIAGIICAILVYLNRPAIVASTETILSVGAIIFGQLLRNQGEAVRMNRYLVKQQLREEYRMKYGDTFPKENEE